MLASLVLPHSASTTGADFAVDSGSPQGAVTGVPGTGVVVRLLAHEFTAVPSLATDLGQRCRGQQQQGLQPEDFRDLPRRPGPHSRQARHASSSVATPPGLATTVVVFASLSSSLPAVAACRQSIAVAA